MGYCNGQCEYLERDKNHTCAKYGKKLAYLKSSSSSLSFSVHEKDTLCEKDEYIAALTAKLKCQYVNSSCYTANCEKCMLNEKKQRVV